jgi:hypothetical protein
MQSHNQRRNRRGHTNGGHSALCPNKNVVIFRIDEAILGGETAVDWSYAFDVQCRKGLLKLVVNSGNSAAGDQLMAHGCSSW